MWSVIKYWSTIKILGFFPTGRQISTGRLLIFTPNPQLVGYFGLVLYLILESTETQDVLWQMAA